MSNADTLVEAPSTTTAAAAEEEEWPFRGPEDRAVGEEIRAMGWLFVLGSREEEEAGAAAVDSIENPNCSSISSSCRKKALTLFALVEGDNAAVNDAVEGIFEETLLSSDDATAATTAVAAADVSVYWSCSCAKAFPVLANTGA